MPDPAGRAALEAIADGITAAIERNDMEAVQALYADDVRIWHSFDGAIQNKDEGVALLSSIAILGSARYRIIERHCHGDRIIQRHELTITARNGSRTYLLPAALFLTVRDGRIVVVDEYADSRQVGEIIAAIVETSTTSQPR